MTPADLRALVPFMTLAATILVLMAAVAFRRSHALTSALSLIGLAASFVLLWVTPPAAPRAITELLVVDRYAYFYMGLILASTLLVALLSWSYVERRAERREEFYILLLLAALGSIVLVASNHFSSFFLGLEILSISLYGLIAYTGSERGVEAGVKYLVLAATSAAFLLFGMAMIYAVQGTMAFDRIDWTGLTPADAGERLMMLGGLALIIVGIGFTSGRPTSTRARRPR